MAKQVAGTYGEALFALAIETEQMDKILAEVNDISQILKENEGFSRLMNHPEIVKEQKIRILENVFRGRICEELLGLMELLLSKNHYNETEAVFSYFIERAKEHKNIGIAYVTSPFPLKKAQKEAIQKKLLETTKYASFEIHYAEESSLIGGLMIRIGDRVADSSIRTKLWQLEKELR